MSQRVRQWGGIALLLAAGAGLRLLFIVLHPAFAGDSLVYGELAANMLTRHVFGFTHGMGVLPTLIRLPGYPLFLAACFKLFGVGNLASAVWVQLFLSLADCCLIAGLAANIWGSRTGIVTLALGALCPFTANYCAIPLTETCCMFAASLALFSFERWAAARRQSKPANRWLVPLTFALSFGILLRPDQALVAVVILPAMLWIRPKAAPASFLQRLAPAAGVAAAIAFPLLLWGGRNWQVFHVIQPLAPRFANDPGQPNPYGFQRWYRTWAIDFKATADVYWNYDGSTVRLADLPPRAFDTPAQYDATGRLLASYNDDGVSTKPLDDAFMQLANQRIAAHPFRYYVAIPALKVANMWLRPRTEFMPMPLDWWNFRAHRRQSWECLAYALLNAAYLAAAAIGLAWWRRQSWNGHAALAWAMVTFVLLRCALLWTIDNSEPRYTLECFPIVILLAGFAITRKPAAPMELQP